ncbi:MAG: hypothetical protein FWG14_10550, partial [Peptococcaceae bacterium]|nr:hypothetical protein [Peptococcaceae bacterium]
ERVDTQTLTYTLSLLLYTLIPRLLGYLRSAFLGCGLGPRWIKMAHQGHIFFSARYVACWEAIRIATDIPSKLRST